MSDADESEAAASVILLYERLAGRYIADRTRLSWDERPWLDRFLPAMPSPFRILDLGCGAGSPIGQYLIEQGCTLTGLDSSPSLIAHCRKCLPDQTWLVGDMRLLNLNCRFEGLVAWDSFFHLTPSDQRLMFDVFEAHADPGAALLFTSGTRQETAIGTYHERPLYHGSLDPNEYRHLLNDHGFRVLSHMVEDPDCGRHTIWLAKQKT